MHTTTDIAREINRSRRWVNAVCRELFGPSNGTRKRQLTDEQKQRVVKVFQQPGRWQQKSSSKFVTECTVDMPN
jgi:hypothetical protein